MTSFLTEILGCAKALGRRFSSNARGNVAILFAFASVAITVGVGAGIDLSRAYNARQKLSQAATLTCQYSTRPSVLATNTGGTGGFSAYLTAVNTFSATSLSEQNWTGAAPTGSKGTYFTATAPSSTSTVPTNPVMEIQANVQTAFLNIIGVSQIFVHTRVACQNAATTTGTFAPIVEPFDTTCSGFCWTQPNGTSGALATPTTTFPSSPSYTGSTGVQWYETGYCLEIDQTGEINGTSPNSGHTAELDCDNGQGTAGDSAITTKDYFPAGYYEVRYYFRSRVFYPDYYPTYLCASTAADLAWANDSNSQGGPVSNAVRNNQIGVYFDPDVNGAPPPLHWTTDNTVQLSGGNLIDECVDSANWVQRSVKIKVTTAGNYWLTFASDGLNDSYGGQLGYVQVCAETCSGTPQDNFPSTWVAASNGGTNKLLFEDTFDSPTYSADPSASSPHSKSGNMVNSLGTTSTSTCGNYKSPPGWTCQTANGWGTGPYNEVVIDVSGAYQGTQYLTMDGNNGFSTGSATRNRGVSRPFLLVPGYYEVDYDYISNVNFSSTANIYGTFCSTAPPSGFVYPATYSSITGQIRFASGTTTSDVSTNILGVYMSHGSLVSTPSIANAPWATSNNVTYAAPSLGGTTSYNNPDGTVSTTPTVPPDAVTWSNYNASVVNPVIDTCGYADSFRWIPRTVYVKITKPAVYWLTFSANGGTADGNGAGVDDVRLTALGSLYPTTTPPTSSLTTTIPVPDPQPDTNYTNSGAFNGFYIVADPKTPTAADQ